MPPNFNEVSGPSPAIEDGGKGNNEADDTASSGTNAGLKATRSFTTLMTHLLIGMINGACLIFAFRFGIPLNAISIHVIMCTLAFQFIMAEAILALAPDSWLSTLNLKHKRWMHSGLQFGGAVLGLAGCFIMSLAKHTNWNTEHGIYALVSMVFTVICLVNGVATLYAYELRKFLPSIMSKLIHICFGIVAIVTANISLAYGFEKTSFRTWATTRIADTFIIMTGAFTVILIINPVIVFVQKLMGAIRK